MSDFGDAGEEFDALVRLWRQAMVRAPVECESVDDVVHQSLSTTSSMDSTGTAATRHVEGGNVLHVCRFCVCGLSHAAVFLTLQVPHAHDGCPPYPVFLPCFMKEGAGVLNNIPPRPLQRQTAPTGVAFSHTASSSRDEERFSEHTAAELSDSEEHRFPRFHATAFATASQMQAALLFSLWQSDGFWQPIRRRRWRRFGGGRRWGRRRRGRFLASVEGTPGEVKEEGSLMPVSVPR